MSATQTLTLKALSALLCYPSTQLQNAIPEISVAITQEAILTEAQLSAVKTLLEHIQQSDLIALQEDYVALFDRGRALSLHLFEHIHGESRARGQAMVDLLDMYQTHGFEMNAHELPDYIPLFLEFLSQRPHAEAVDLLAETSAVLQVLAERLESRDSPYYVLFDAMLVLAGKERANKGQVEKALTETDETILKMDEIWEEETVTFMANQNSCGAEANTEQPVIFTPPKRANAHSTS
jgi:nitrate reductase delta subunit